MPCNSVRDGARRPNPLCCCCLIEVILPEPCAASGPGRRSLTPDIPPDCWRPKCGPNGVNCDGEARPRSHRGPVPWISNKAGVKHIYVQKCSSPPAAGARIIPFCSIKARFWAPRCGWRHQSRPARRHARQTAGAAARLQLAEPGRRERLPDE